MSKTVRTRVIGAVVTTALLIALWIIAPEIFTGAVSDWDTFLRVVALIVGLGVWAWGIRRFVRPQALSILVAFAPVVLVLVTQVWPYVRPVEEVNESFLTLSVSEDESSDTPDIDELLSTQSFDELEDNPDIDLSGFIDVSEFIDVTENPEEDPTDDDPTDGEVPEEGLEHDEEPAETPEAPEAPEAPETTQPDEQPRQEGSEQAEAIPEPQPSSPTTTSVAVVEPEPAQPDVQPVPTTQPPAEPEPEPEPEPVVPPTTTTTPTTTQPPTPVTMLLRSGSFQGLTGHRGSGSVSLLKTGSDLELRFSSVDIGSGPDLLVYLVSGSNQKNPGGCYVGALQAERGSFSYNVSRCTGLTSGVWTVLVWCRSFSVEVANATF